HLADRVGERAHRVLVGDVEFERGAADLVGQLLDPIEPPRPDIDVETLRGECAGGGFSDSGTGSGDDGGTSAHAPDPIRRRFARAMAALTVRSTLSAWLFAMLSVPRE